MMGSICSSNKTTDKSKEANTEKLPVNYNYKIPVDYKPLVNARVKDYAPDKYYSQLDDYETAIEHIKKDHGYKGRNIATVVKKLLKEIPSDFDMMDSFKIVVLDAVDSVTWQAPENWGMFFGRVGEACEIHFKDHEGKPWIEEIKLLMQGKK